VAFVESTVVYRQSQCRPQRRNLIIKKPSGFSGRLFLFHHPTSLSFRLAVRGFGRRVALVGVTGPCNLFNDQLWIGGGWFNSYEAPPRDLWSSPDGKTWSQVAKSAPWIHSSLGHQG